MSLSANLVDDKSLISQSLKNWSKHGEKNFLKSCSDDFTTCKRRLLELIIKVSYGEGKTDYFPKVFNELSKLYGEVADFHSDIVDIFWLVDNISEGDPEISKDRLVQLIVSIKDNFSDQLLIERLSEDTLEACSIISSKNAFSTKYVRTKTRLFYKQKKFNLLREENEGYAKCITVLATNCNDVPNVMNHLRCLIGYFDLDPNRVINLILDSCEYRISAQNAYTKLLKEFSPDQSDISHFLGHKFSMLEVEDAEESSNLYRLAALLVTTGLASLEKLIPHLNYKDSIVLQNYEKQVTLARNYRPVTSSFLNANSSSINQSLNDFNVREATDRDDGNDRFDRDRSHHTPSMPTNNSNEDEQQQQQNSILDESQVIEELLLAQINGTTVNKKFLYNANQRLNLITAFLKFGDWTNAQKLLDVYPGYWAVAYRPICKALCNLIHYLSENLYDKHNNLTIHMTNQRRRYVKLEYDLKDEAYQQNWIKPSTTFEEWGKQVLPLVGYLGPYLSQNVNLMVKLCRLSTFYLQIRPDDKRISPLYQAIFNMLDETILPSLSLVEANCCLTEEVWNLISLMPFDHRYRLYGQWMNISYNEDPFLIKRKAEVLSKIRAILKRLSKENTKVIGRQLGKLSHSNPCLIFEVILSTLQAFSNLIEPIVDCLKYVSSLSYDVLTYCIISSLANDNGKLEDFQLSQSLQSTATFTGLLCKKYQFDLTGIFSYVNTQLQANQSYDLVVLREIILKMTGVDTSEEITDEQLEAFNGGDLLLLEGGYYSQIRNTRRNASRLADALMQQKLVMPLLIGMSKMRDSIIYIQDTDRPVKLTGKLYDQCLGTMVQFITFLNLQISRDDLTSQLMPIDRMLFEYNLPADTTFCLFRTIFEQRVYQVYEKELKQNSDPTAAFIQAANLTTSEIADLLKIHDKKIVHSSISFKFYTIFWCLSLGDLSVPTAAYARQINILKTQQNDVNKHSDWTAGKRKKELDRLQTLIEKLQKEKVQRTEHVERVNAWLKNDKENWLSDELIRDQSKMSVISSFLKNCIFPRLYFTSSDAIYAAEFIIFLHKMKTPNFITLFCFDQIFTQIPQLITLATENEAHRFGRFLCTILSYAMNWHSSNKIYDSTCLGTPGFITTLKNSGEKSSLDFENYRHVVHKWHYCLTKFFVSSLESSNSTQIRNALIVLTKILPHFPKLITFGNALERRLKKLKDDETDKRPDLKTLALRCIGLLRPGHATWMEEKDFHHIDKDEKTESINKIANKTTTNGNNNGTVSVTRKPVSAAVPATSTSSSNNTQSNQHARSRESTANSSSGGGHHHLHHSSSSSSHHHSNKESHSDSQTKSTSSNNNTNNNLSNSQQSSNLTTPQILSPNQKTNTLDNRNPEFGPIKKRRIQASSQQDEPAKKPTPKSTSPSVTSRKVSGGNVKKREDSLTSIAHSQQEVPSKKSRQCNSATTSSASGRNKSLENEVEKRSSRQDHKPEIVAEVKSESAKNSSSSAKKFRRTAIPK